MAVFRYKGVNRQGETVIGIVEARHSSGAIQTLAARQITAFDLSPEERRARQLKRERPKREDYFQMLEQMSVLIAADIPVLDTVASLASTVEHEQLVSELDLVAQELRKGERLGEAISAAMPRLPRLVPNLIRLGEQTGRLAQVLKIVSVQMGMQEQIKKELRGALVYPAFLMGVGVAAVIFLFYFVVPRFSRMVESNADALPPTARFVFDASALLRNNTVELIAGLALVSAALVLSARHPRIRAAGQSAMFKLPLIGKLLRQFELANWTRTVGLAFQAKANLLDAVSLARNSISSANNMAAFDDLIRDLRAGVSIDDSMAKIPSMEPVVINLVRTGVKSGRLSDMFLIATEVLDSRVNATSQRISKLAEPVAVLAIAALIGFVVISLVSAMTSIYDFAF
jgi:general secretion pathway protein F